MKTRGDDECELAGVSVAEAREAQASWAFQPISARSLMINLGSSNSLADEMLIPPPSATSFPT